MPYGTFTGCLKTKDCTPIEPDNFEHKVHAAGIGTLLEINPVSGQRVELIEIRRP